MRPREDGSPSLPLFAAMELEPHILNVTLGSMFISVVVSASLFGILTTQCHYYFLRFKNDPSWLKYTVGALWIIDFIHQISASVMIFEYGVRHRGDVSYLPRNTWPPSLCVILEPLPAFVVQMYFTRRLYHLNPNLWFVAACTIILAVIAFMAGIACGMITTTLHHFVEYKHFAWLVSLWLVTCSICDIAVTIPVAWTLYSSRTGFRDTDILLVKLILWTVNTSALPASVALLEAVTFITNNDTLIHLGANIVLAKLYSNTLLATLNRRGALTRDGPRSLQLPDTMLMSQIVDIAPQGRHANGSCSQSGFSPLLPFPRHQLGSKNDSHDQVRSSVSTHRFSGSHPNDL